MSSLFSLVTKHERIEKVVEQKFSDLMPGERGDLEVGDPGVRGRDDDFLADLGGGRDQYDLLFLPHISFTVSLQVYYYYDDYYEDYYYDDYDYEDYYEEEELTSPPRKQQEASDEADKKNIFAEAGNSETDILLVGQGLV